MPWNKEFECMPIEKRQQFQLEQLKQTVSWVSKKVPFYRRKLKESGITSNDITHLEDVARLPFTVKNDLRDNYPFGLCAVPLKNVVRIHASSGTTGKPITGPYTQEDLDQWTECMARNFWAAGVRPEDIVQNAYGHGLFTGGLGFHQGAGLLKCTVVPTSAGLTERQITLMKDFGAHVLCCTPSYALTIAERAEELKVDIKSLPLRVGIFGAEPWTTQMRNEIEERMGIKAMEAYGLTELGGPGVAFDCKEQNGLHINEDHYLAEIVDPATMEPLPLGEKGELIFTSLQRRAMPMIRYRTGDLARASTTSPPSLDEPATRTACSNGVTLSSLIEVKGRLTDQIVCRANGQVRRMHALALIYVLREMEGIAQFRITQRELDRLDVEIVPDDRYTDATQRRIEHGLRQRMGPGVNIDIRCCETIPPTASGKHACVVSHVA